ncbi:hypothetical protein M0R45_030854 [Rubus argutus]|uniref:Uncharacterized protein n=1 Tax=Rubus argutus TaxID=59490 RepID=A0AAW1WC63_RUBAR
MSVQLADKYLQNALGIVEDVVDQSRQVHPSSYFVILDMDEDPKLQVLQPSFPQNNHQGVLSTDLVKGKPSQKRKDIWATKSSQASRSDHSSVVAANQELQELSYLDDDDDDMF